MTRCGFGHPGPHSPNLTCAACQFADKRVPDVKRLSDLQVEHARSASLLERRIESIPRLNVNV